MEENAIYAIREINHPERFTNFIMKTMVAIEIWRVCKMNPIKLISISAEIVLKLRLDCEWLNIYMEEFLEESPINATEKMEIEN